MRKGLATNALHYGARGALLIGLALVLAACSSSPAPSQRSKTTSSSSSTTTRQSTSTSTTIRPAGANCSTAQLKVTGAQGGGAAGTISQIIVFENISTSSCSLHGFPGVAGLDGAGHQIVQATRVLHLVPFSGPTSSLPTVTLAPGESASSLVFATDVPTGTATSCITYAALLVTPPNAVHSVHIATQLPGCSGLRVEPVYPGTTGMG